MTPPCARSFRILLLSLSLLSAPGCVSVLPAQEAPRALIAPPAASAKAPVSTLRANVVVHPPEASRAFSGSEIAVVSDQAIVYLKDVKWADLAPKLAQSAALNALARASGDGRGLLPQAPLPADYELFWRISDLSVSRGRQPVRAEAEAILAEAGARRIVATARFVQQAAPRGGADRQRADALALALQQLADDIAEFVAREASPAG